MGLDLRDYRAIRTEFFLGPDLWEDSSAWAFPDASKLTHGRVLLEWHRADLYGLLWQMTLKRGRHFESGWRASLASILMPCLPEERRSMWYLKPYARRRRCKPRCCRPLPAPSWSATHLADAKGQISPRSFLVTLKQAHTITERHHADANVLLHFEGIKRGVQEASLIRLRELQEDYPWVEQLYWSHCGA